LFSLVAEVQVDRFANFDSARAQVALELGNRTLAVMDDRGDDGGVGAARGKRVEQMARFARAARGDHRDSHSVRDHPGYFEIVAGLGAVGVDRIDAQFAGPKPLALARPVKRVAPGGRAPAVDYDLMARGQARPSRALDLHREHDALAAKGARAGRNQAWIAHRARVDRD